MRRAPREPRDERWANFVFLAVCAAIVFTTFWFIHRYAVNTILEDNWRDVYNIAEAHGGFGSWGSLWYQHGENRVLVYNLVVLGLTHTVRFNIIDEEYLSAILLVVTCGLFVGAHHRRSPSVPWLYYLPAVAAVLSLNQGTMNLFGFALTWYLVICSLALVVFLIDRPALGWPTFVGAVIAAIAGSFSSLEGLLIWPVGLFLLYHRSRSWQLIAGWIMAGAATLLTFFHGYNFQNSDNTYGLHHPLIAARFFFFAIGNVLGVEIPNSPSLGYYVIFLFGVTVFALAAWILVIGLRRSPIQTGASVGVAMVLFGVLYTLSLTIGRSDYGLAVLPRYAIFDLILLAGCYLAVIDRSLIGQAVPKGSPSPRPLHLPRDVDRAVPLLLVGLIAVQILVGTSEAFTAASTWHASEIAAADVTANMDRAPNAVVQEEMGSNFLDAGSIRLMTGMASANRLSLFGTALAADLRREGLTVDQTPPKTRARCGPNRPTCEIARGTNRRGNNARSRQAASRRASG